MKYSLLPFQPSPYELQINVTIKALKGVLEFQYELLGAIDKIKGLDSPLEPGVRTDELWRSTCFEWFLKIPSLEGSSYWEFNASPKGQWASYELEDYRKGLKPCGLIHSPLIKKTFIPQKSEMILSVGIDLNDFFQTLQKSPFHSLMAVTAVIEWNQGGTSYFSLKHPPNKPDFHHADGFLLNFPKE